MRVHCSMLLWERMAQDLDAGRRVFSGFSLACAFTHPRGSCRLNFIIGSILITSPPFEDNHLFLESFFLRFEDQKKGTFFVILFYSNFHNLEAEACLEALPRGGLF